MNMNRILVKADGDDSIYAQCDSQDFFRLNSFNWGLATNKQGQRYAVRNVSTTDGTRKRIYMHRYLLDLPDTLRETRALYGHPLYGEHLDKDGLNNRRSNLVISTASEMGINKTGTYPGVIKRGNRFEVTVTHQNNCIYVGTFNTIEEAALARDRKALALFPRVFMTHLKELHLKLTSPTPVRVNHPYKLMNDCYLCEYAWQQRFLAGEDHPEVACSHKP